MGVTLIVYRDGDAADPELSSISMQEWLGLIDSDPELSVRTADHVATNPLSGEEVRVAAGPGEADFAVDGRPVPLLRFRNGSLVTNYLSSMQDPADPVRCKIAAVAAALGAVIGHDAGDDLLDW